MEHVLGVTIAAAAGLFASVIGFDKERSFYPVVLFVVARKGGVPASADDSTRHFTQVSLSVTARLNTRRSGVESRTSATK